MSHTLPLSRKKPIRVGRLEYKANQLRRVVRPNHAMETVASLMMFGVATATDRSDDSAVSGDHA